MFFSAKAALILRTTDTELVDMSKNAVSGFMPSMRPLGPSATASTSAGTGSEGNTTLLAERLRAVGPDRAVRQIGLGRRAADVVDDELVPGLLQIGRHALAHHAEPDKTDLHVPLHSIFFRHAGARSGHPRDRAAQDVDGRIKSGHDENQCCSRCRNSLLTRRSPAS